ncbi:hypothetical protein BUALT_Bualt09G0029400 [Buddleja alternifolia]|uniref:Myb/SANT-like domain-containing protein n=1 Tax=Buddleja alternifolia TaxID=168488 RepID=A0AAV6X6Q8_9LAMI|nr:hypothetical protein BUALT_Bualt09G0029400 [Buddleja alternifolia]
MEMENMNIVSGKGTSKGSSKGAGKTSQVTQGRSSAKWDSFANIKFIELCEEEIGKGNRPNSHFNRNGWNNLLKKFNEMTGRNYAYKQFRNHWDTMKKECKFKNKDLSLIWFRYDKLFSDVAATGESARAPSQRSGNESIEDQMEHVEIGDSDGMEDIGSPNYNIASRSRQSPYINEMFPSSTTIKRKCSGEDSKMKKKMSGAASLREDIHSLLQCLATKNSATFASSGEMTIGAAIEMLSSIPDITPRSKLWNYACNLLSKKDMREVFASQPCHESRLCWLEFNYD